MPPGGATMDYRNLGKSGLKVSPLCLGAMTFGEPGEGAFMHNVSANESVSHGMMDAALERGINFKKMQLLRKSLTKRSLWACFWEAFWSYSAPLEINFRYF